VKPPVPEFLIAHDVKFSSSVVVALVALALEQLILSLVVAYRFEIQSQPCDGQSDAPLEEHALHRQYLHAYQLEHRRRR
jgi:hypothetical protein